MSPDHRIVAAKLAEIERRYKRKRHGRTRPAIAALRIRDLSRLMRARYGSQLPNDAVGRDCARIIVHHLAALSGDPRKRISGWLELWAPWLQLLDAKQLLIEAISNPYRWRADKLGWRLWLTEADRAALRITTIGAIDLGKAERTERRRDHHRKLALAKRRAQGAKPRAEYLASVKTEKPWIALGISRRTWYRRRVALGS